MSDFQERISNTIDYVQEKVEDFFNKENAKRIILVGFTLLFVTILSLQMDSYNNIANPAGYASNDIVPPKNFNVKDLDLQQGPPRVMKNKKFLYGIFSMMSEKSRERRQLIRDTYLKVNQRGSKPWVCSLDRYQQLINVGDIQAADDCVVLYAFIVAAAPDQPKDHYRTSRPIALLPENRERDVVYLNIEENMEEGKTYTYFKYAYQLSTEIEIDYVAKTDDDTFMAMPTLYQNLIAPLPNAPYNTRYYGGQAVDYKYCGQHEWCAKVSPHGYFAGQFYFMSTDMAGAVSDDATERYFGGNQRNIEDLDLGYKIFQWSAQTKMPINQHVSIHRVWHHPLKTTEKFLERWELFKKEFPEY